MVGCRWVGRRSEPKAAAFEVVYDAHQAEVYGYLVRRLDVETAETATAEVFAAAWREFVEGRRPRGEVRRWLLGLAVAAVARHRRAEVHHLRRLAGVEPASNPGCRHVAQALVGLDPVDRDLLSLHAWAGVSHRCAGELVGVAPAAAQVRIDRAYDVVRRQAGAA